MLTARFSRRRQVALVLSGLVVVATVAGCSGKSGAPPVSDTAPAIAGLGTYPGLSHQHTTDRQNYPQKPPVGGPHWPHRPTEPSAGNAAASPTRNPSSTSSPSTPSSTAPSGSPTNPTSPRPT